MTSVLQPVLLPMNRPTPRPYRGGSAIEGFRRQAPSGDEWAPEDFLASTVTTFGSTEEGLTVVDGRFLRDLIEADPVGYLGEEHVARFGADPQLLCKLLHTGEQLFIHAHPDALFARRELGAPTGKTEAWVILAVDETAGSSAWLGFTEDVPEEQLTRWFDTQDSAAMLAAMNEVELHPGDTLFVPAGVPHAIGEGVLLLELQEPADLSVILEYAPFERLRREDGLLGLDPATALRCVDRRAFGTARLADAVGALPGRSRATLFPEDAQSYFRAEALALRHGVEEHLSARFCVLVVTAGAGSLAWRDDRLALEAGDVVLVPHGAGEVRLSGDMRVTRCMPPSAA